MLKKSKVSAEPNMTPDIDPRIAGNAVADTPDGSKKVQSRRWFTVERRRAAAGYVFVLPWILGFCIFLLWPLLESLILSVSTITELEGLKTKFIGFGEYHDLFFVSNEYLPAFFDTIKNSFLWLPFIIVFALFIAILLNKKIKMKGVFRVIYFLPVLLGTGFVFQQLGGATSILTLPEDFKTFMQYYLNPQIGEFIANLISEIMRVFWKTGVQIIIFLAGLQSIPESYYEAAKVDNANAWYSFWKITVPILSPIILLNTVYTLIDSFRDTNNKIAELIIRQVFNNANFEEGSAMGWVYFVVVFLFVGLILLIFGRHVHYED